MVESEGADVDRAVLKTIVRLAEKEKMVTERSEKEMHAVDDKGRSTQVEDRKA